MEHSIIDKQEEINKTKQILEEKNSQIWDLNKSSNKTDDSQTSLRNGRLNEKIKILREKVERVETMQTAEVNKLFFAYTTYKFPI